MFKCWSFNFLLLLWMTLGIRGQSSYFRRSYYSPVAAPTPRYYHHNHAYVPLTYSSDLLSEETKHKESAKGYSKKLPFRSLGSEEEDYSPERYTSAEYSSEAHGYNSKENDSREYTIGTAIRVQHPITVPKKSSSAHPKHVKYTNSPIPHKSSSFSDINLSSEVLSPEPLALKKHPKKYTQLFEPDPFHVVPPPKTTAASMSANYDVYEHDQDDYEPPRHGRIKTIPHDRYKGVVSKKQIEKYLEDQEKFLDQALKMQLLNSPKFQQLLKAKEEEIYEHDLPPSPPPSFHPSYNDNFNFKPKRSRRRPVDLPHPPNGKPLHPLKPKRRFRSAILINV